MFLPPDTPHFYDHIKSSPLWATAAAAAGGAFFFFLPADFCERKYIQFMVISPTEQSSSAAAAAALEPVPTGL